MTSTEQRLNIPSTVKDPHYRYTMPKIQITTQGSGNGIKTNWVNLPDVSNALKVPLEYPIKFIARELGSNTETKNNSYLINGSHKVETMQEVLDKFIRKYVLCPKCHIPEIHGKIRIGKKNEIKCTCRSCGATSKLDSEHNFAAYIRSYPPPYEKDIEIEKAGKKIEKKGGEKKLDKKMKTSIKECCLNLPKIIKDEDGVEKNIEYIKEFLGKYNFNIDIKFYCFSFGIFPNEIYTKSFLDRIPLIKHFIEKESDNRQEEALYNVLIGLQDLIFSRQKGENQKYVSSVLYYLYDNDIITEDFWLKYIGGSIQEKYNSIFNMEEAEKKLKEAAKDFTDWIENGPYEGEEKETKKEEKETEGKKEEKVDEKEENKAEDDEDDEKGKKKGKKKKGKKKKEKEKEKEKDDKDKKKDSEELKKEEKPEEKPEEKKEEEKKEEEKKQEKKEEEEIDIDNI